MAVGAWMWLDVIADTSAETSMDTTNRRRLG
jgi:hypothetical protein